MRLYFLSGRSFFAVDYDLQSESGTNRDTNWSVIFSGVSLYDDLVSSF